MESQGLGPNSSCFGNGFLLHLTAHLSTISCMTMNRRLLLLSLLLPRFAASQPVFPVRGEGEAPDRAYHVVHYKIEVSFDESKKSVKGKVTTTLVPFLPEFKVIEFDALNLHLLRVEFDDLEL